MKRTRIFLWLTALLLCATAAAAALSESALTGLWNSGCDLLFHTDNVTVTGQASFSLDGEHFKTAELNYIQDGYNSYYGLKLLTPRGDGTERETGWIIIADADGFYNVMETYEPGIYHAGHGTAYNTLLRRSITLDALTEMGGVLVAQMEPMLPEGAVTVTQKDGAAAVHVMLNEGQIPEVAASALNVAASYLSDRWFAYGFDRVAGDSESTAFDNYITVTQALTDGTVRWTLKSVDAEFVMDGQGRLTAVNGSAQAMSTFWDGSERTVEVAFSLNVTDYGASHVKPFDAEEYQVTLPVWYEESDDIALSEEEWDEWMNKTVEMLKKQGFPISSLAERGGWTTATTITVSITNPEGSNYMCVYAEDGSVQVMDETNSVWFLFDELSPEGVDADTVAKAQQLIRDFTAEYGPDLPDQMEGLMLKSMIEAEDGVYLVFTSDGDYVPYFVVRIQPILRLTYCSWLNAG